MLFSKKLLQSITILAVLLGSINLKAQSSTFQIYQTENTPGAPSVVLSTAGSCTLGAHNFTVTFVTAGGETNASNPSSNVTCTAAASRVTVTIPVGGKFVTGRNIYASKVTDGGRRHLVSASPVVSNNTATTYTFNTADASLLTITEPTSNKATNLQWTFANTGDLVGSLITQNINASIKSPLNSPVGWCSTDSVSTCTIDTAFWSSGGGLVSLGNGTLNDASGSLSLNSVFASTNYRLNNLLVFSSTVPTISSGFGTSPSVASNNGTSTFRVNVGTGGVATSGVVGLPTATTGWNCLIQDFSTNIVTRQTASNTTTVTVTAASAWTASDILIFQCVGF